MRLLQARIKAFFRDQRGAFATIFGIVLIVVVATAGAVVDFVGIQQARTKAQLALDAATLALQPNIYSWTDDELIAAAEDLIVERIADDSIAVDVEDVVTDTTAGSLYFRARLNVPTVFVSLVNVPSMDVAVASQAIAGGNDVEVSLVVDITLSMDGDKIEDLIDASVDFVDIVIKDDQEPFYSKVGLVAYSNAVNVGSYAAAVRGPVVGPTAITNAVWRDGATKNISGVTRQSQAVVSSTAHGLANGDYIRITGVNGMTQLNNKNYIVSDVQPNSFKIKNPATGNYVNSTGYNNYTSGGSIQKCLASGCEVVVTSTGHGIGDSQYVKITGVGGMTDLNNSGDNSWQVSNTTANTFQLTGSTGWSYSNYTSGGNAQCLVAGCQYYRYTAVSGATRIKQISNCVTERVNDEEYTDAPPSTAYVGRHYVIAGNGGLCVSESLIVPLTADKESLTDDIEGLDVGGATAGQIGIAWGWYLLSPDWGYLWPDTENVPAAYDADHLIKVSVIMTDGEFNTIHCNGVPASDSSTLSGANSERINCAATNGDAFDQADELCSAMKDIGIVIYTVAFDIGSDPDVIDFMEDCATDEAHALVADDGDELAEAFANIAQSISDLRLAL